MCIASVAIEQAKPGVKTPGVQLPLSRLEPEAIIAVAGAPDWIAIDAFVWVSNKPRNSVTKIDPVSNRVLATLTQFNKPCSGLAIGFGSLWVPNCGNSTLTRVDLNTNTVTATIPTTIANSEGGITVSNEGVWLLRDGKSTLVRIDPVTNKIADEIALPSGCFTPAFGFGSVWVTCTGQNTLVRINPQAKKIVATIPVGPKPRFLAIGERAVWALTQGDGAVFRIDPNTDAIAAKIDLGIPGEGGDIAVGEGSVWATSFGFPLSRIDPKTNAVVQQFAGKGGDAIRAGRGAVWLSNYMFGTVWKIDPNRLPALKGDWN
ncbi:MAG: hypothetical protein JO270_04005 [Acidobacteriaceae bacterium]|nr:hypothetical protein [Acidobacteriaceae bacterium]MBV8570315.1 hypothetical protein [Acidobacteriaceae bacterium]